MLVIGELINGMYPEIARAILGRNKLAIQKCALEQLDCGAGALDLSCGAASKQPLLDMPWLVETIQEVTGSPLCLDSSNPEVIKAGLKVVRNPAIVNSTTADLEKLDILVGLAKQHKAELIGITISAKGIPQNLDQRVELAVEIITYCQKNNFPLESLYLDPILLPINVAQGQMQEILRAIREFKLIAQPSPKIIIGLSNISQGAGDRSLINRTFLTMAVACGLNSAILNPQDKELMDALITAELILNENIYCDSYLEAYRKK